MISPRNGWLCSLSLLLALSATAICRAAEAGDARSQVETSLTKLHAWVDGSQFGPRWRGLLRSAELEKQLQADQPELAVLKDIIARYRQEAPASGFPLFDEMKASLAAWAREIESGPAKPVDLADLLKRSGGAYNTPSAERVATAKAKLTTALAALDNFFRTSKLAEDKNLQKSLLLTDLRTHLSAEKADAVALDKILDRFYSGEEGLERQPFLNARRALRDFIIARKALAEAGLKDLYGKEIDKLTKSIEAYKASQSPENEEALGNSLQWLTQFGQAPRLVKRVRDQLSHPNLLIHVDQQVVTDGFAENVDETNPVNTWIFDTHVVGNSRTTGKLSAKLVPNKHAAMIDIFLRGENKSNNQGYNGPVVIQSSGITSVSARKRLIIEDSGISDVPATADCKTNSTIHSICARSGLVERIAWKRAGQQKWASEQEAGRQAAVMVGNRMNSRSAESVTKANQDMQKKFKAPLMRHADIGKLFDFSTTEQALTMQSSHAEGSRLAAPGDAPKLSGNHPISMRLHQSLVRNMSETALSGFTLTDVKLEKMLIDMGREVPEELKVTQETDPWTITFAPTMPLSVKFEKQTFRIALRGSRFTRGDDNVIPYLIEISANYKIEKTPEGAKAVRTGDVEVEFLTSPDKLTTKQIAFKTFLRRKFSSMFKEEFVGDGLELPGQWEKLGTFKLAQIDSDAGWITMGWSDPVPSKKPKKEVKKADKAEPKSIEKTKQVSQAQPAQAGKLLRY